MLFKCTKLVSGCLAISTEFLVIPPFSNGFNNNNNNRVHLSGKTLHFVHYTDNKYIKSAVLYILCKV